MQSRTLQLVVVEDSPVVARAALRFLEAQGHQVVWARSCAEALMLESRFDAGVLDIDLPDGNGIDLAQTLYERGAIRIAVFYSSNRDPQERLRAAGLGSFVDKQDGVAALERTVTEAVLDAEEAALASGAEGLSATLGASYRPRTGKRRKLRSRRG